MTNIINYSITHASVNDNTFFVNDSQCFYNSRTDCVEESSSVCKLSPKTEKSLFDRDGDKNIDISGWMNRAMEEWNKTDTIAWLLQAGGKLGHTYGRMSPRLAMTGQELLRLSRQDFINFDQLFGKNLYELLHKERDSPSFLHSLNAIETVSLDDGMSVDGNNYPFDKEPENDLDPTGSQQTKRPPLWIFLRNLLFNPKHCPDKIRWEDYGKKTFRFVQHHEVARLWGMLNNNENMNYRYFTRLIRTKYEKDVNNHPTDNGFLAPDQNRLVYKFGKRATGLETDNPNFENQTTQRTIIRLD